MESDVVLQRSAHVVPKELPSWIRAT